MFPGPSPSPSSSAGVLAMVFAALFLAGSIPVALLVGDAYVLSPLQPADEIAAQSASTP